MTISTLFVDVGGVLLSNGWDTELRQRTAEHFGLDPHELQQRHEMVFEDYERGFLKLEEYLNHAVFFKPRTFTYADFTEYLFNASTPYPEMIDLVKEVKERHKLKVALLSNEGKEIAASRFKKFAFNTFVDYSVVSGFVGVRKPDLRIYKLALGLSQALPNNIIYIDDRLPFVALARGFGINAIHHIDAASTRQVLHKIFAAHA